MVEKLASSEIAQSREQIQEWAKWECPECGDICDDPETVLETSCHNGHSVILAIVYPNDTSGWREAFTEAAHSREGVRR